MSPKQKNKTIGKIDADHASKVGEFQKILATGDTLGMRLWEEERAGLEKEPRTRDYETVGYVLRGRAELRSEGETVTLEEGDSYLVPAGAEHSYRILETFSAVEATSPPSRVDRGGHDDE